MEKQGIRRKLAAVLHADVKGYSRLMGEDEVATLRTLTGNREVLFSLVQLHGGRVVDTAGDGFLVEFPSVVDAVECAVEFQREMRVRNAKLPENRKMEFRIGINVGDVIQDGHDIFGDGVNIAARLEGLADAGGICISGTAYDQLKRKLTLGYEFMGERNVKNIPEPVRAYRVRMDPEETHVEPGEPEGKPSRRVSWGAVVGIAAVVAAVALAAWYFLQQPDRIARHVPSAQSPASVATQAPSVAVLPFANKSGDSSQDYFTDGVTEGIIGVLARIPALPVIARKSAFAFRGKVADVKLVGEKLGVNHVLEGSVLKRADRLTVEVRLRETETGRQVWEDRSERALEDVFAMQSELALRAIEALKMKLTPQERDRITGKSVPTKNIAAYEKFLQGVRYLYQGDRDMNARARTLFEQSVAMDPSYAQAYASLGQTYLLDATRGWSRSPRLSMRQAFQFTTKALDLDDSVETAHRNMSLLLLRKRQHDRAIAQAEKAVQLSPNDADSLATLGMVLVYDGRPDKAMDPLTKALRLNPQAPSFYLQALGDAYFLSKRYEDAIAAYEKGLLASANNRPLLLRLVAAYALAGNSDRARTAAQELLKTGPTLSLAGLAARFPYRNPGDTALLINALRKAGLD